jgi:hypothetical protein
MQPLLPFAGAKGVGMEKAGEWGMYLRIATCIGLHEDSCKLLVSGLHEDSASGMRQFWKPLTC